MALKLQKLREEYKSRPQGQCEGERRGLAAVSARRETVQPPRHKDSGKKGHYASDNRNRKCKRAEA
ncbi:hypothetical protein TH63_14160 [Rufibacter radiotolerans]|uniref:Uncharacterized protein n=1 Tax=Rufibacter radiotolerans TaxID=1379910 RepID=A0A0H4W7U2_9BACT|nr:hypothetical protein TH63_14160 [Rufibacter radiotolerans]